MNKLEKFTMAVKTPFTMRKFKTFMVEDKPKTDDIPTSRSVEALSHAKVSFAQDVEEDDEGRPAGAAAQALATPHTKKKQLERELEEAREESEPLDDRNEKFVLTTSTPLAMRKFQTFMIEDKKPAEQPVKSHTVGNFDAIANLEREAEITEEAPLKTSDMYVLTTMTPLPQRKERASESHLERIAREKSRSTSRSPEKGGLFIMGNRSSRSYYHVAEKEATAEKEAESVKCAVVQPQRAALGLESPRKERSHDPLTMPDFKAEEKERERSKKGKREERERDKERLPKSPKMPITARDQPMLVGDTFSHSESIDCLSAVRRMEFEAEKATLISIDRSLIEDSDTMHCSPHVAGYKNGSDVASTCVGAVGGQRAARERLVQPANLSAAARYGLGMVDCLLSAFVRTLR
ncbi:hypothetical protein ANCCEY_02076 [Ancylostoma ceylanicum]|uniref:Uncharacterized protein n=1 Tax=Ancylostoma ceylanicum TaxID=53326 RepID=A0A0D6MCF0_9BILA|nr:hypothetical protein ANCCEY_02076 [Ancylostoma ceylanicum]